MDFSGFLLLKWVFFGSPWESRKLLMTYCADVAYLEVDTHQACKKLYGVVGI